MSDIPNDPALMLSAERAAERLGGSLVQLDYVMGETNYWRATVYPTREAMARRLMVREEDLTEGHVFALEHKPIGTGKGATRGEAIANIKPVLWR